MFFRSGGTGPTLSSGSSVDPTYEMITTLLLFETLSITDLGFAGRSMSIPLSVLFPTMPPTPSPRCGHQNPRKGAHACGLVADTAFRQATLSRKCRLPASPYM